ncbi:MAG: hypothetical protein NUW22_04940 [Acidobacteria bacterium]|nr:hypothetical protein [Acidobacteriota bacterium]
MRGLLQRGQGLAQFCRAAVALGQRLEQVGLRQRDATGGDECVRQHGASFERPALSIPVHSLIGG